VWREALELQLRSNKSTSPPGEHSVLWGKRRGTHVEKSAYPAKQTDFDGVFSF
jgi:hypothetical protein